MFTRHCQLCIVGVYPTPKASQSAIKFPNCNGGWGGVNGDAIVMGNREGLMVMELCFDCWLWM